jgi:hypothetical protein
MCGRIGGAFVGEVGSLRMWGPFSHGNGSIGMPPKSKDEYLESLPGMEKRAFLFGQEIENEILS